MEDEWPENSYGGDAFAALLNRPHMHFLDSMVEEDGSSTITNNGLLFFSGASSADGAIITNNGAATFSETSSADVATILNDRGILFFTGTSQAGSAIIINNGTGAILDFSETSSAEAARITNNSGAILNFIDNARAGSAIITNSGDMRFSGSSTAESSTITNNASAGQLLRFLDNAKAGSAIITNNSGLSFEGSSTADSATILNTSFMAFFDTSKAGTAILLNSDSGTVVFNQASSAERALITNNSNLVFRDSSSAKNAPITNNFTMEFQGSSSAGNASITNNFLLVFGGNSTADNATITSTGLFASTFFSGNSRGGTARFITEDDGTVDISQLVSGGTTAGSIEGSGRYELGSKNLTVGSNNMSTEVSGVIADGGAGGGTGGSLTKVGTGTLILSGINPYTGATTVLAGALIVNGSIGASSLLTINPGAIAGGIGILPSTIVAGTGSPGNSIGTMNISGNLTFLGGSTYLAEVSPTAADRFNVTGTATLAGTVSAVFAPGTYVQRNYTILSAAGGRSGTFGTLTTTSLPAGFEASLSYSGTDVFLDLVAQMGTLPTDSFNPNQSNVATALNTFFNNGGTLPPQFVALFGLTGGTLGNVLSQLSGEVATGAAPASQLSTGMFLNAMLDPFVSGRNGGFGTAMGFAPQEAHLAEQAFAAALPVKAPPLQQQSFEQRWSVWGAAYGGRKRTDGEAGLGSNDLSASAAGFAAGADYRVSPGTVIGAAVAIGETRWNVSGLGKGNADVAQVGGYASTRWQSFYLSGAAAFAWHRAATDRTLNINGTDRLEADFDAKSFGARVEGGRRFGTGNYGITPYAAVQVQSLRTPAYSEAATAGSNQFALAYTAQTVTDTRSELGFWADTRMLLADGKQLTLRARAAWVHDFNPGSRVNAAFQTLPGASFTVDGAAAPRDAALTSAVAELKLRSGVTVIAKFDGEFASRSHTLAGTGTLKYAW